MPSHPAVVLLHFFGSSHREWAAVTDLLAPDRQVLSFDLPGFGDAANQPHVDAEGMADAIDRRIIEAGIVSCIVVGHSMSGKATGLLAARSPAYLRGIVLVTSSPPCPEPMGADAREQLLAFDGSLAAAGEWIDGITAHQLPDDLREVAIADAMRASLAAWRAWVEDGSQQDLSAAVGVLDLPTHVVAGASDPSLGEAVQREKVMPHFVNAALSVIRGGHALPLENPQAMHREIEGFARRLDDHGARTDSRR